MLENLITLFQVGDDIRGRALSAEFQFACAGCRVVGVGIAVLQHTAEWMRLQAVAQSGFESGGNDGERQRRRMLLAQPQ